MSVMIGKGREGRTEEDNKKVCDSVKRKGILYKEKDNT